MKTGKIIAVSKNTMALINFPIGFKYQSSVNIEFRGLLLKTFRGGPPVSLGPKARGDLYAPSKR